MSLFTSTIAATYAQLSATALGYSTCWVDEISEEELKIVLEKENIIPIIVIVVGYKRE